MQCDANAKMMADQPMADMAAEASIIPPPPSLPSGLPPSLPSSLPPPHQPQRGEESNDSYAPVTAPNQADHGPTAPPSPHPPPPALPNLSLSQASPEVNRPDSAYGGSGGTPSLRSTVCKESTLPVFRPVPVLIRTSCDFRNQSTAPQTTSLLHQTLFYNHSLIHISNLNRHTHPFHNTANHPRSQTPNSKLNRILSRPTTTTTTTDPS